MQKSGLAESNSNPENQKTLDKVLVVILNLALLPVTDVKKGTVDKVDNYKGLGFTGSLFCYNS